ncbi:hypothetical protein Dfri01_09180 [Dyadobacter frigoris]|uniref:Uncharacterized protein n=1 Tax=Dyadobacter frigoris TaxID=2576211 RepID=A0A4U6D2V5_9BACT|nr:hypothetical protein [Dyadobacter frigoris]TKT90421.1 hypothetical protein FDK13_18945 [Dyadobacter frigoris]GLU51457.1 hypothetical protein Dfri01_09180 [Dyadobacter frigoris]
MLNLLHKVFEPGKQRITVYGGNYDFYAEQKRIESEALNQEKAELPKISMNTLRNNAEKSTNRIRDN